MLTPPGRGLMASGSRTATRNAARSVVWPLVGLDWIRDGNETEPQPASKAARARAGTCRECLMSRLMHRLTIINYRVTLIMSNPTRGGRDGLRGASRPHRGYEHRGPPQEAAPHCAGCGM